MWCLIATFVEISSGEAEEFYKLQYQSVASRKRLGSFRSVEAILAAHKAMPVPERKARLAWGQSVVKKVSGKPHARTDRLSSTLQCY